jgi:hypothetical protein
MKTLIIPNLLRIGFKIFKTGRSGLVLLALLIAWRADSQSISLVPAWYVTNGIGSLANNAFNRGVAYSVVSNQVFVSTRSGATTGTIDVFNGTNGALLSGGTGVNGSNLGIDQIGVGDDGVLYGAPLITSVSTSASGSVKIYSWTNWTTAPYLAYQSTNSSDPVITTFGAKRIGDTMAVSGSGVNTLILLGVGAQGTNFVLLHTGDGINFTSTVVLVPAGLPSTAGNIFGISFYTNNTFLVQPGANATTNKVFLVSYPANFASQTSVMGTVLGFTGALTANYTTAINYAPQANLLGVAQTASAVPPATPNTVGIYSMTNFPTAAATVATNTIATPNSNGNATGGVALGGPGKTNYLYVLESNNGLQAYSIVSSFAPIISGLNGGITNAFPPQTLTLSVSGTTPLSYNWFVISGTVTNPISNNTNFLTVTGYGTNQYFVIVSNSYGSATSSIVGLNLLQPITNSVISQLWKIAPGTAGYAYLPASGDTTRGMGYDAVSNHVIVATTSGSINILDGNTGTNIGPMLTTGLPLTGQFPIDQLGAGDDGVVYACNLAINNSQNFLLYSWSSSTTTTIPAVAYNDSGSSVLHNDGNRYGDTMAVRGAGTGTQIILGSRAGTSVALLTTADGINFTAGIISVTNAPSGFAQNGISFGAGNTLWAKSLLGHLYEISFDPVGLVGAVVLDYPNPGKIPSSQIGVAVDPVNNILAGVDISDIEHDLKLYQLTGTSDAPVLFEQAFFSTANVNGNAFAPIAMKYPRVYALDVNNGLLALTYGVPAATLPNVITPPASVTVYTNIPILTLSVTASGSLPLYYQWRFNSNNINGATSSTYSITNPPLNAAGYYDVIVHNIAGTITSTPPALLTLIVPTTSTVVTQLWTLAAGSRSYLDSSSYNTRGLAYDTHSGILLVADHNNIYDLAGTNGSDLGVLNMAGLPTGGLNSWLVDQIGVADDGVLYSCNLTLTGPGFSIIQWNSITPGSAGSGFAFGGSSGADPSGTGDRWGDTMSVRGSGVNTEIICGSYNGSTVLVFDTTDGATFTPHLITVAATPAGFASLGVAFGSGNTFWAKGGHNYNLRQVYYD